jgi:putative transposase
MDRLTGQLDRLFSRLLRLVYPPPFVLQERGRLMQKPTNLDDEGGRTLILIQFAADQPRLGWPRLVSPHISGHTFRALAALFGGAVGKDTVSRTWRKVKGDWDAWNARSLADEPIVRLILDGTVVRVRLDRKATAVSLLVVLGVREDGQKVLLAIKSMGGESAEAWRAVLDDLIKRGLRRPEFLIVDGAPGTDKTIAAVWDGVPVQRCTVHKRRNLLAHAPERLHEEITADYTDMIYAATCEEIATRRKAFIRKWRLKHRAVADSLEEAGERLFTFTRLPPSQWRSVRTTNAIERLHEEFKRRINTQTVLPSADTAAMLFWALLAAGQINMRKVDGLQTLATKPINQPIDVAA